MQSIADLHVHSRYSRATSKELGVRGLYAGAKKKGVTIMATGDFTHPGYFAELKEELAPIGNGFYRYQGDDAKKPAVQFILVQEISGIYTRHGSGRRIHNLVMAPSLGIVQKIIRKLETIGNLKADGRPILKLDSEELVKIILDISPECLVIPAHVWTPWFSMFGSKSGFDSVEECFGDMAPYIYAIETGLSSDPLMNWMVSDLDDKAILSSGDAHSSAKLAREANVFELEEISYANLVLAIKNSGKLNKANLPSDYIKSTVEFYPEEGKYHFDGHRECGVVLSPKESEKHKWICPACKKELTIGVLTRVHQLATRTEKEALAFGAQYKPSFKRVVPLLEIIASAYGSTVSSRKALETYQTMIAHTGNELRCLIDMPLSEIATCAPELVAEGIRRMRAGEIFIAPGYDGVYGKVRVFKENERPVKGKNPLQQALF